MLILLLGTTRQEYSKNIVIITDRKCRDQVSDQELGVKQNVTNRVGLKHSHDAFGMP